MEAPSRSAASQRYNALMNVDGFLQTMVADPANAPAVWLVLADWLEEQNDPRYELVRLLYQPDYRSELQPEQRDGQVRKLLASGMAPVVPTIENSIGMRFALIPAGTFLMGAPEGEGEPAEHPQHEVEITRPFWMGIFPVTQEQYQSVIETNPSYFCSTGGGAGRVEGMDTSDFPVEQVDWEEALDFCSRLSALPEEKPRRRYRLPTEADWEYACRGGAAAYAPYHFGSKLGSGHANVFDWKPNRTTRVGSYPANALGLFDMHGNVWEWCHDGWGGRYYARSPKRNPPGPRKRNSRVMRGGSWWNDGKYSRISARNCARHETRYYNMGFRVCFTAEK